MRLPARGLQRPYLESFVWQTGRFRAAEAAFLRARGVNGCRAGIAVKIDRESAGP